MRALPEPFREDATAAAEAVVLDPAGWGAPARVRPPLVDVLQDAVVRRRRVAITYAAWDRDPVERLVDPWGLVTKREQWYLVAGVRDPHARTRLHVTGPTVPLLARRIAGWAECLEVLEPVTVRDALARLGAELVARNVNRPQ